MSRLSRDRDSLLDHMRVLLLAGLETGVADPAAITAASHTITYTTDDPALTADRLITVADGDSLSGPNINEMAHEVKDAGNKAVVDITAVRTTLVSLLTAGVNVFDATAIPAMTMGANKSSTQHIAFTYTTDAPVFTLNGTVTVADGDAADISLSYHEFAREASRTLALINADIGAMNARLQTITKGRTFAGITLVPTQTSAAMTVTYTTDDPSISAAGTTTIADGDGIPATAILNDLIAEGKKQLNAVVADITAVRAKFNLYLNQAGIFA